MFRLSGGFSIGQNVIEIIGQLLTENNLFSVLYSQMVFALTGVIGRPGIKIHPLYNFPQLNGYR